MKRIAALLLSAAMVLGLCTGCGDGDDPYVPTGNALSQEEVTKPKPEATTTHISLPYYPDRGMNPYQCSDFNNRAVFSLIYQGLFAVDRDHQVWPMLCESYQVSWDMKTYTFQLAAATFSDGTPLTAADVKASLMAAKEGSVYKGRFSYVDEITVTEDGKVQIDLQTPYENFPLLLDVPIVKAAQVEAEAPLGTGPYICEGWGDGMGLRRSAGWWCKAELPVYAEQITLLKAESPTQLRDTFEFSDLSMVGTDPGSESYADFHSDYELWDVDSGVFLYLACNDESAVFSNSDMRKALTFSIDREGLVEEYYRGFAEAAVLPVPQQSPFYSAALARDITYDPGQLTRALADHPQFLGAAVTVLVSSSDPVRVRAARAIAQALTEAGLKATTSELAEEDYRTALSEGEFDLHLGQTRLSATMDLSAFFNPKGALAYGGLEDATLYALCLETLANRGNYNTLYRRILEEGQLCPILFRSYAVFTQRGSFPELAPARDNVFFYHLEKTDEEARMEE